MARIISGKPPKHFTTENENEFASCLICDRFLMREVRRNHEYEYVCLRHGLKFKHRRNYLEYEKFSCQNFRPAPE